MDNRKTLISSGEHIAATLILGSDYGPEEYLEAVDAAREAGVGEAYANKVLGADAEELVSGTVRDRGEAVVKAAERRLRRRGIDPRKASYQQFADALVQVTS